MSAKNFDHTMHYLRGFAIINIVIYHAFMSDYIIYDNESQKHLIVSILITLFSNSTNYLLFISGFLFYKLNQEIDIIEFYKKKLSFIVLPYIITSLLLISFSYIRYISKGAFAYYIMTPQSINQLLHYLINGLVQGHFWFMPLICIIFIFCPYIFYTKVNHRKRLLLSCIILPLLFHRLPLDFFSCGGIVRSANSILHHIGIFFAGSLYFIEKNRIDMIIKYNIKLLASSCLVITVLIFIDLYIGKLHCNQLYIIHKFIILSCIIYLLNFYFVNKYILQVLSLFAKYSFSIYFWHIFINTFMGSRLYNFILYDIKINIHFKVLFVGAFSLIMTLLFCMFLKKITGKYSRYIIGS